MAFFFFKKRSATPPEDGFSMGHRRAARAEWTPADERLFVGGPWETTIACKHG